MAANTRPMLILAPMHPVMTVFDLDSTTGPPLPARLLRLGRFEGRWNDDWLAHLIEHAKRRGIRVNFKPLSLTRAGFVQESHGREGERFRIVINDDLGPSDRFGVLCHELAHVWLGHLGSDRDAPWPSRSHLGRAAIEIEAEATAYLVTRRLGLVGTSAEYISQYLNASEGVPKNVSFDAIAKGVGKIEKMARTGPPRPRPAKTPTG